MNERQSCIYCKKQNTCEKATHIENYQLRGCHEFIERMDKFGAFSSIEILNNDQNSSITMATKSNQNILTLINN